MRSHHINALHTAMFAGLMILSPTTSLVTIYYPATLPGRCLAYLCIIGIVTTLILWRAAGECPCTKYEREAMLREEIVPYTGPWLAHYANKWFGLRISTRTSSTIPMVLLAVPLLMGIIVEVFARL